MMDDRPSRGLRGGSAATGWGCASYASLVGAIPPLCRRRGRFGRSRPQCPACSAQLAIRARFALASARLCEPSRLDTMASQPSWQRRLAHLDRLSA